MVWTDRRRLLIAAIALLGALAGFAGGVWLGHAILLRNASYRLTEYANDLSHYAYRYAAEVNSIWTAYDASGPDFCSKRQISDMRSSVFRSLQVKDIGRSRDGGIYCSALSGRLVKPTPLPKDFMLLANDGRFYQDLSLTEPSIHGPVLEKNAVDILVSPSAFDYWSRPRLQFAVLIVNPATGRVQRIAGENLSASATCSLSTLETNSKSSLFRSVYESPIKTCVVTSESLADVWDSERLLLTGYEVMGALVGLSLALTASIFFFRRSGLVQQLRRAIRRGSLHVVYQPLIELPSRKIVGVEALARWNEPGRGPVAPDLFVRIAEEYGFLGELTELVLKRATGDLADLMRQLPHFTLSINLAVSDLIDDRFYANLEEQIRTTGIRPGQLAFELTERSTADLAVVRHAIERLHRLGHKIHIDDFGTGFSNLAYLHELAADVIKIDRVFMRACGTEAVTASILPQMLSMAESLAIEVVVEGVETESQLRYLESTAKPMLVQGFYFGHATTAADIAHKLWVAGSELPVKYFAQSFPVRS